MILEINSLKDGYYGNCLNDIPKHHEISKTSDDNNTNTDKKLIF